jgi:hypothetical protein
MDGKEKRGKEGWGGGTKILRRKYPFASSWV